MREWVRVKEGVREGVREGGGDNVDGCGLGS